MLERPGGASTRRKRPRDLLGLTARVLAIAGGLCFASPWSAPAFAHVEVARTAPQDGVTVGAVPRRITLVVTEPPARTRMRVLDGCGRSVARAAFRDGRVIGSVRRGEPGRWRVAYALEADDGHETIGRFSFTVRGRPDCSPEGGGDERGDDSTKDRQGGDAEPRDRAAPDRDERSGAAVLLPALVVGGLALAGVVGLALRARGG